MALVSRMKNGEKEGVDFFRVRLEWNPARRLSYLAFFFLDLAPDFLSIDPDEHD